MLKCWNKIPDHRPSFDQLEMDIDGMLTKARSSQAAAQDDYDDTVVNMDVPRNKETADYRVIVPHPYEKFEAPGEATPGESTPNSTQELLAQEHPLSINSHPLDLGYDKVKSPVEAPHTLSDVKVEVLKPVGNAAVEENNNGYLAPIDNEPTTQDKHRYTALVDTPKRQMSDVHFEDNPGYLSAVAQDKLNAEVKATPPSERKENIPQEGYMPMDKISPAPAPKPKPSPRPPRTESPKLEESPKPSPKPQPKPASKPKDFDKVVPKPSLKPRDSHGYLAPVSTATNSKDDDYLAPVS